jgi:hypothetical protein
VTRKSITTSHAAVACDVCGRTLLRGEHAEVFITGGSRRMVCELCTPRATHEGWIREGMDLTAGTRRAEGGRRSLFGRLGRRRGGEGGHDLAPRGGEALVDDAPPAPDPEPAVYAAPREVHAVPTNLDLKMSRALELFNGSEHRRTVSGVARSLGAPVVAVRPSETEGSLVGITVAWEISWYRFEVDLADEARGVRLIARGMELDELDPEDRVANAAADETGELQLVA